MHCQQGNSDEFGFLNSSDASVFPLFQALLTCYFVICLY